MKVLHLPTNIASQMRVTVAALREMGVEARGLTGISAVQNAAGLEILPRAPEGAGFLSRQTLNLKRAAIVLAAVEWADVIHWHYDTALPFAADLKLASLMGKKLFVEFWGSDIRDPEIEMADNPWFAQAWNSGEYECKASESRAWSWRTQGRFSRSGAKAMTGSPAMAKYLAPQFYPSFLWTSQRLPLDDYQPVFPAASSTRPLVVHAPTAPGVKGTKYVLAAVERLKTELDFDFQLIHGMTPQEARHWITSCDVFIDQLIAGEYGVAATEAMALGKPVICFIKESIREWYPDHFPIHSANPETVETVLRKLICDGPGRHQSGQRSRAWAEERHDARKVVAQIVNYYHAA